MKSYHLKNRSGHRSAFTLVEMLMVVLIIGILVSLVGFAAQGAWKTAQEFTIQNEVMQLDAQIAQFKTKHGFYPPTIGPGLEVNNSAKMARYLLRISPNNGEGNGTTANTGLTNWWRNVGQHLDQRSSLVFWLSGLCKSKQYPLSGSAAIAGDNTRTLAPYNGAFNFQGNPETEFERDVMFEFNQGQLEVVNSLVDPSVKVAVYNQPNGKDNGESAYQYLDYKSYGFPAYHNGFDTGNNPINFYNPKTFQIVAPGMDGLVWQPVNSATGVARTQITTNVPDVDEGQLDNITNFTQGRLDKEID